MLSGQTFTEQILPHEGETEPTDEVKKLMCLEFASRNTSFINPLQIAKEMYEWVKGDTHKMHPEGAKWDIQSNEAKYSYDLTGCTGNSTTEILEERKGKHD